jgi:hypothetical protein
MKNVTKPTNKKNPANMMLAGCDYSEVLFKRTNQLLSLLRGYLLGNRQTSFRGRSILLA